MGKKYTAQDGTEISKGDTGDLQPGEYKAKDGTKFDTRGRKGGKKGCLVILVAIAIPFMSVLAVLAT